MSNQLSQLAQEGEKILAELEEKTHLKKNKRPFYQKIWFWILILFFVVLIILALLYFRYWLPFKAVLYNAESAQNYFISSQEALLRADFRTASLELKNASKALEKTEQSINSLGFVAQIGPFEKQYNAMIQMISSAENLSQALKQISDLSAKTLSVLNETGKNKFYDLSVDERREILKSFYESSPEIWGAIATLQLSRMNLAEISLDDLHPLLVDYLKKLDKKLKDAEDVISKAAVLSRLLPEFLGYPNEKTYLFLLQNNDELRATGGFIGTMGVLKIKDGKIKTFDTENVYEFDKKSEGKLKINLPKPIDEFMQVDWWYLRDANWLPDFEISSQKILEFFDLESQMPGSPFAPQKFDGVIAITPKVIQDFLSLAGAVEVKNFVFNSENFKDRLEYLVEVGYGDVGADYSQRKNIIGLLSLELVSRFEKMEIEKWVNLVNILEQNLKEKNILTYLEDNDLELEIIKQNWAGKVREGVLDYIFWVDSNLAALKTDQYVKRNLSYQVYFNKTGDLIAKASMNYENQGSFTWKSTRYRTYARLYVPRESKLISTGGSMKSDKSQLPYETDVFDEFGKTVFGAFISIEPGEKGTLSFEYKLPENIKKMITDGHYSLLAQKQPGVDNGLYLDLKFKEPIISAYPAEQKQNWGDRKYQLLTDLKQDREFKINF